MTRTAFSIAAILISLLAIPSSALPLRITGWAIAPIGQGSAPVRVEVFHAFRPAGPVDAARPRSDSSFALTVPEPGLYRVVVRAEGFLPLEITPLPVVEETELPAVSLEPALPLEVRLTGPEGKAAAWVAVCARAWSALSGPQAEIRWEPAERCATTGEDGRITLTRGPEERPALAVADPRFSSGVFEIGEEASATLRLGAARAVSLAVHGPDGRPAAGVLARIDGFPAGITDPSGRLAVAVPEAGVDVELLGEDGLRAWSVFFPGESGPRTVTLRPPRFITGKILDAASRAPLARALVWVAGDREAETRTAADGTFRLPAGQSRVLGAAAAGHVRRLTVLPRGARAFTLALPRPGHLRDGMDGVPLEIAWGRGSEDGWSSVLVGRVLGPDGKPFSGALVEAARREAETDGEGRFRLDRLQPGATVSLLVRAPGLRGSLASVRVPPGGEPAPIEIRLVPAGSLAGRVTGTARQPVAGAPVRLEPSLIAQNVEQSVTDDEGRYFLDSLAPGRWQVTVLRRNGGRLAGSPVDIREGANRLDLAPPPDLSISGRVLDERGAPVAGARLFLEGADPEDRWLAVGAEDGSFHLGGVPEGDYRLSVLAAGFAQAEARQVRVAGEPVRGLELRLGRGGAIVGRLLGITAEELNGLVILAQTSQSRRLGLPGEGGSYRIPDMPPGRWKVTARTASGRQALGSVEVAPGGGETVLDLHFTSGLTLSGHLLVDGQPAAGTVLATDADRGGGESGGQSPVLAGGAFRIPGLQPFSARQKCPTSARQK